MFGTRCPHCNAGFCENDFVMRARNKVYHIDCFRCAACSRQLVPGDEFSLRDDGLFCKADHQEVVERTTNSADLSYVFDGDSDETKSNTFNNNNNETKGIFRKTGFKEYLIQEDLRRGIFKSVVLSDKVQN